MMLCNNVFHKHEKCCVIVVFAMMLRHNHFEMIEMLSGTTLLVMVFGGRGLVTVIVPF